MGTWFSAIAAIAASSATRAATAVMSFFMPGPLLSTGFLSRYPSGSTSNAVDRNTNRVLTFATTDAARSPRFAAPLEALPPRRRIQPSCLVMALHDGRQSMPVQLFLGPDPAHAIRDPRSEVSGHAASFDAGAGSQAVVCKKFEYRKRAPATRFEYSWNNFALLGRCAVRAP